MPIIPAEKSRVIHKPVRKCRFFAIYGKRLWIMEIQRNCHVYA